VVASGRGGEVKNSQGRPAVAVGCGDGHAGHGEPDAEAAGCQLGPGLLAQSGGARVHDRDVRREADRAARRYGGSPERPEPAVKVMDLEEDAAGGGPVVKAGPLSRSKGVVVAAAAAARSSRLAGSGISSG